MLRRRFFFCLLLLPQIPCIAAPENSKPYGLDDYITHCEAKGVEIPPAQDMDCAKGIEIPVYKTVCRPGQPPQKIEVNAKNYTQLEKEFGTPLTCDNPSEAKVIGPKMRCIPGARLLVLGGKREKNSVCVLSCRKLRLDSSPSELNQFDDMSMICHNVKVGSTCFFAVDENASFVAPDSTTTNLRASTTNHYKNIAELKVSTTGRSNGSTIGRPGEQNHQWLQMPKYSFFNCISIVTAASPFS